MVFSQILLVAVGDNVARSSTHHHQQQHQRQLDDVTSPLSLHMPSSVPSITPTLFPSLSAEPSISPSYYPTSTIDVNFGDADHGDSYRSLTLSMASIAAITCLFAMAFVVVHRNKPIVKIGQPPFLFLISLGSFLISLGLFFQAFDHTHKFGRDDTKKLSASCVIRVWLNKVGAILVYVSLFCKMVRVYKLTRSFKRGVVTVKHVLPPLVVFLLAAIAILIAMTVVNPPQWYWYLVSDGTDENGNITEETLLGFCYGGYAYLVSVNILFLISMIMVLVMAWKSRSINNERLTDTKRIVYVLSIHVLFYSIWIGMYVYFEISGNYETRHLFAIITQFVVAISSVGFLILPRTYCVLRERISGKPPDNNNGFTHGMKTVKVTGLSDPSNGRTTNIEMATPHDQGQQTISQNGNRHDGDHDISNSNNSNILASGSNSNLDNIEMIEEDQQQRVDQERE